MLCGFIVLASCALGAARAADAFPSKPIHIIVPAGAGGNLDITARVIGKSISETLGQPVLVENRAGANSLLGTRLVAKAPADGYTLLAISNTFAIAPSVLNDIGYDPLKDFVGIGLMNRVPLLMVEASSAPDKTMADFVARAKQNPGKLSYASGGSGTTTHLAAAMFMQQEQLKLLHVPYKGNAPAIPDVVSGHVNVIFDPINTSAPLVRDGKFRALGLTGSRRSPVMPDVPTIAEQGVPGYEFAIYTGLVAPAGTPPEVLAKLHAALVKATSSPELKARFSKDGTELLSGGTTEEFTKFLAEEVQRYAKVAADAGLQKQ
jgi:tripartite-type tricarboxylate transporter receptor subunit TctC